MAHGIGNRIAPAKFIAAGAIMLVTALGAAFVALRLSHDTPLDAAAKGVMLGFDLGATYFLLASAHLLRIYDQETMRRHAATNDANRTMLLVITAIVSGVILFAIGLLLETELGWKSKALIVGTLLLAWLFANSVYALHYAHMFVTRKGGIDFPGEKPPGYADFVYFAFTLGMTFQTSDVSISDRAIRNVVTAHCLAAFVFNLGILAFTINILGG